MGVQVPKTGTDFNASLALPDKTGTLLPDHADAQPVKTGMEMPVFHVSVEDNGTLFQDNALVQSEAGTDSHAFNAPQAKPGTPLPFHAHAPQELSGTALNAEHAPAQADSGTSNSMIVSAEPETGTEHNVLSAQPTPTGTERPVSPVPEVDFGTHWIWSVNVQMIPNGMVPLVSRHAQTERSFKTVFACAPQDNSNNKENALTIQLVKMEPIGTVNNVSAFHATQVLPSTMDVDAAKPPSSPAPPVLIGTDQDASMLQTSAQPVWCGTIISAKATHQNAQVTLMNSTVNAFLFQPSAQQVWPGTLPTAAPQPAMFAHQDHITTESSVSHTLHATTAESGTMP